eukprot:2811916-Rhodomonas_salina.2
MVALAIVWERLRRCASCSLEDLAQMLREADASEAAVKSTRRPRKTAVTSELHLFAGVQAAAVDSSACSEADAEEQASRSPSPLSSSSDCAHNEKRFADIDCDDDELE